MRSCYTAFSKTLRGDATIQLVFLSLLPPFFDLLSSVVTVKNVLFFFPPSSFFFFLVAPLLYLLLSLCLFFQVWTGGAREEMIKVRGEKKKKKKERKTSGLKSSPKPSASHGKARNGNAMSIFFNFNRPPVPFFPDFQEQRNHTYMVLEVKRHHN